MPVPDAVLCRDLVVRYGSVTAVDGLSFEVAGGEVVALLGPNGAGKTSTVESLEGYRRPTAGSVRVLGLDPLGDHRALVARIGVMLQRGGVYPMLGPRRALELFASYYEHPEDPAALLARLSLEAVAATPWRHLSGGEQQRLALALALVGRPEVVFLDEPTAGVDPEGRLAIRQVVAELAAGGVAVLLTTHELAEAEKMADRVVIVVAGRAAAAGRVDGAGVDGLGAAGLTFGATPGLDVAGLGAVLGTTVSEGPPGRYQVAGPATPERTAALTGWLAERQLSLTDLRTGRSLEDAYLSVVTGEEAGR
ncbi:MAG: ABC transporter ATP-binding protein [Acidimicrobiales bacterium]